MFNENDVCAILLIGGLLQCNSQVRRDSLQTAHPDLLQASLGLDS